MLHFLISNWRAFTALTITFSPILLLVFVLYKYTSLKQPLGFVTKRVFLGLYNLLIYRRRFIWEQLYDILCWLIPSTEWKHMNWGYASLNKDGIMVRNLKPEDEADRYSIQLYHYISTAMGIFNNLEGKTLMEVSSGRGGGLDYLTRYLNPKKCIGVDISEVQVGYCKKIYQDNSKLDFVNGDSQKLSKIKELEEEQLDIVINVESGHCYPNFKKFIQEVDKVLAPGGYFAYSDFRPAHEWAAVEEQLKSTSLKVVKKENISENVMHSLKLDEERKWKLMDKKLGPVLKFYFKLIGGVKGSHSYDGLSKGSLVSMAWVLRKPEVAEVTK
jgi:SAM-dependent methyltransferase